MPMGFVRRPVLFSKLTSPLTSFLAVTIYLEQSPFLTRCVLALGLEERLPVVVPVGVLPLVLRPPLLDLFGQAGLPPLPLCR